MNEDTFSAADLTTAMESTSTPEPSAEPSATADATAPPGAATTAPAAATAAEPSQDPTSKQGPIPFDVHHKALQNAREKAVEEAKAQWQQQYGWAQQIQPDQFQQMAQWYQRAHADPVAFTQDLISELQAHPQYGAQLRSLAARALASGRGQPPADEMPKADVAITDAQGQVVGTTYSADQLQRRDQWLMRQILAQAEQRFGPQLQTADDLKAERERWRLQQQADDYAKSFAPRLQALPQFAEHADEIATRLRTMPMPDDHPATVSAAAYEAYLAIVVPKLQAAERQSVVTELQQKAQATTVNPQQTSTAAPKSMDEMSTAEALRHALAQASA